jgi:hypothetical protein
MVAVNVRNCATTSMLLAATSNEGAMRREVKAKATAAMNDAAAIAFSR